MEFSHQNVFLSLASIGSVKTLCYLAIIKCRMATDMDLQCVCGLHNLYVYIFMIFDIIWLDSCNAVIESFKFGLPFSDGMYMMEIDRVLRPGGYWVLSGPPINWKNNYQAWQRPKEELDEEQRKIEEVAKLLCWEKKHEIGEIAIWQKRINNDFCREQDPKPTMCKSTNPDDVWYVFVNV